MGLYGGAASFALGRPWCSQHGEKFAKVLSPRMVELLDIAEASGFYADISQGAQYKPWGKLNTMQSASRVFSFGEQRILHPQELLCLHGFPVADRHWLYEERLRNIKFFGFDV